MSPGSTPSWTVTGCWWCMLGRRWSLTPRLPSARRTTPSSTGWLVGEESEMTEKRTWKEGTYQNSIDLFLYFYPGNSLPFSAPSCFTHFYNFCSLPIYCLDWETMICVCWYFVILCWHLIYEKNFPWIPIPPLNNCFLPAWSNFWGHFKLWSSTFALHYGKLTICPL